MKTYAQLNDEMICVAVSSLSSAVDYSNMIEIDPTDPSPLRKKWNGSGWDDVPHPEPTPQPRHISVGAFYDRFGAFKYPILADTNPVVKALIQDASVRKYIDLDRADLPAGLQLLVDAGHAIDPAAIIEAEIQPHELP